MKNDDKPTETDDKLKFIKDRLENEQEGLPVSLEKGNVVSSLSNIQVKKEIKREKSSNIRYIRVIASLAAAVAVVFGVMYFMSNKTEIKVPSFIGTSGQNNVGEADCSNKDSGEALNDGDYGKIEKYFLDARDELIKRRDKLEKLYGSGEYIVFDEEADYANFSGMPTTSAFAEGTSDNSLTPKAVMPENATESDTAVSSQEYGKTNIQVEEVDEGDIIKNDGKYIYIVSNDKVHIVRASDLKEVSSIEVSKENKKDGNRTCHINDIYVTGNKLTVIENCYDFDKGNPDGKNREPEVVYATEDCCCYWQYYNQKTIVNVYDLTDIEKPVLFSSHNQDGGYRNSRMVDGVLYTLSFYDVDVSCDTEEDTVRKNCVPTVDGKRVSAGAITINGAEANGNTQKSYVLITAVDTAEKSDSIASYAYLGYCNNIYSSKDTLYFTEADWDYSDDDGKSYTLIRGVSLSKSDIKLVCEGRVEGDTDNQYSMDTYNGYFRIATTSYNNRTFKQESNVFILDGKLRTVGELKNIADNEMIKSVRFMGDTAYVVTFEQTDPLFVIDLSVPEEPKILGSIKLPGYSTYLHPIGDDKLVGIGYGGDEKREDNSKIKVTLFDISNKTEPKVISSYEIKDSHTEINGNPKAFLYYKSKNLIGIPVCKYSNKGETFSYALLEIGDNEMKLKDGYVHDSVAYEAGLDTEFFRGTYIDDTLYTISNRLIKSFEIVTGEETGRLELK